MDKGQDFTTRPEDIVSWPRKISYALGVLPDPVFMGTVGNFLILFYNGVLGLPAALVGTILVVPRVWDAITDPYIGKVSDNCRSPLGRRRPFILLGGILTAVTYALLWIPPRIGDTGLMTYLLVVGVLFFTAYTVFSIPYNALGIELTPDYNERTMIYAVRNVVSSAGQMLWGLMPFFMVRYSTIFQGDERFGYGAAGVTLAVICVVPIFFCFFGTREREAKKLAAEMPFVESLKYTLGNRIFLRLVASLFCLVIAIMTLASYVNYLFLYYLEKPGLLTIIAFIQGGVGALAGFIWYRVSQKIGKSNAIFFAMLTLFIGSISTLFVFNRAFPYLTLIYGVLYAFGWSGVLVMASAIMADITDLDELKTGKRREGSYGGIFGFIFKMGVAASLPILGFGLDFYVKFEPELGANQTPETFLRLRMLTAVAACVCTGVGLCLLWRFPLTRAQALDVRRQLEERRGARVAL